MIKLQLLSPIDQPLNNQRLIDQILQALSTAEFNELQIAVAYAKHGIINVLRDDLIDWKKRGGQIVSYIGIDQKITSREALGLAIELFDAVYIINHRVSTFHPKIYAFKGPQHGKIIIGSNNLTSGGLEINFESAATIEYSFENHDDKSSFDIFWDSLKQLTNPEMGISLQLSKEIITTLDENNIIAREISVPGILSEKTLYQKRHSMLDKLFEKSFSVKRTARKKKENNIEKDKPIEAVAPQENIQNISEGGFETLAIQITPHHNGEIFLSKSAVNERPNFFGYPFTGTTTPKKIGNKPYTQRTPDPLVNITVYGNAEKPILTINSFPLNTVYYTAKAEIRITCSALVGIATEYSVLLMSKPLQTSEVDYEMVIHTPDSEAYEHWGSFCTKKMPTGGTGKKPRAYGWI